MLTAQLPAVAAGPGRRRSFSWMTALLIGASLLSGAAVSPASAQSNTHGLLSREVAQLSHRLGMQGTAGEPEPAPAASRRVEAGLLRPPHKTPSGLDLLGRYRAALERESRRLVDKNPSILSDEAIDEEDSMGEHHRRDVTRIFMGANNRLLSQILEVALHETASLRRARDYMQGVRLDVMSGGGVRVGSAAPEAVSGRRLDEGEPAVAASFNLLMVGRPRLEIRTTLPGAIRTRVEVPLTSPGIRATMSRRLAQNLRGTLSGGVEQAGSDRWVSAGVAIRF